MSKIIEQDITTIETGFICHQVNCQGVMGSGVAKAIAKKWPKVLQSYNAHCAFHKERKIPLLGSLDFYHVKGQPLEGCDSSIYSFMLTVVNIFGQNRYGSKGLYTNYDAVDSSFLKLYNIFGNQGFQLYAPWKMGCARGGGNWDTYKAIIEKYYPNVIYCKWRG